MNPNEKKIYSLDDVLSDPFYGVGGTDPILWELGLLDDPDDEDELDWDEENQHDDGEDWWDDV